MAIRIAAEPAKNWMRAITVVGPDGGPIVPSSRTVDLRIPRSSTCTLVIRAGHTHEVEQPSPFGSRSGTPRQRQAHRDRLTLEQPVWNISGRDDDRGVERGGVRHASIHLTADEDRCRPHRPGAETSGERGHF